MKKSLLSLTLFLIFGIFFSHNSYAQICPECCNPGCSNSGFVTVPGDCPSHFVPCGLNVADCGGASFCSAFDRGDTCDIECWAGLDCDGCGGGGGCFTGETPIKTPEGEKEIKDLNIGESIISVDPLTGEELQSKVENIYELEREGYFEVSIELPNGEKETLKVTGEHPLYVKQEESNSVLSKLYTVFESIKKKLHHTF